MLWVCHSGRWWACSALSRSGHWTTIAKAPAVVAALLRGLSASHRRVVVMYDIINALAAEEGDVVAAKSKEVDGVTEKPNRRGGRRGRRQAPTTVFVSFLICMCRWLLHLKDGIHGVASLMAPMVGAFFLPLNSSGFFLYPSTAMIRTCTCAIRRWPSPQ